MNIDKQILSEKFKKKDYDFFFKEAREITNFLLIRKYSVFDEEKRNDMTQECLENLWKKVIQEKINPDFNLMSFIWQNSTFKIGEIFRKENRRNRIAKFISIDEEKNEWTNKSSGNRYNPELLTLYKEETGKEFI